MTDVYVPKQADPADAADAEVTTDELERHSSRRGRFKFFTAPALRKPPAPAVMANLPMERAGRGFGDLSALINDDRSNEEEVVQVVGEMVRHIVSGSITTSLFAQGGPDGMSLTHVWFGPDFPLFRHSHPGYGDCLYYVLTGSIVMGSRTLGPGDGFFVPNGLPYKYKAGPEGVQVLEFRAGGGIPGAPGMKLDEPSVASVQRLIEGYKAAQHAWVPPAFVGDEPSKGRTGD